MTQHLWFDPINKRFFECHDSSFMESIAIHFRMEKSIIHHFGDIVDFFDYMVYALSNDWIHISDGINMSTIFGNAESIRKNWKYIWPKIEKSEKILIQEASISDIPKYDPKSKNEDDLYFYVMESGRSRMFFMPRDKHILKKFVQLL